jgi:hypothetical protein
LVVVPVPRISRVLNDASESGFEPSLASELPADPVLDPVLASSETAFRALVTQPAGGAVSGSVPTSSPSETFPVTRGLAEMFPPDTVTEGSPRSSSVRAPGPNGTSMSQPITSTSPHHAHTPRAALTDAFGLDDLVPTAGLLHARVDDRAVRDVRGVVR